MVKQLLPAIGAILCLSSCTMLKSLNLPGSKQETTAAAPAPAQENKFIENITVQPQVNSDKSNLPANSSQARINSRAELPAKQPSGPSNEYVSLRNNAVESASAVQLKYAVLLNTEVESLPSASLLESVDQWYGVRYRRGGNNKAGVDCSGFTVAVYAALYGISLPRISTEQYRTSRKISTTELQEGDLVFFSTRGSGVSHVGIYLSNNRFIHASVSKGVMVNSLFEPYYLQRFVGAGRIVDKDGLSRGSAKISP